MTLLIVGIALWYVTHLLPMWAPGRRAAMAAKLGEGPYKGLYALTTIGAVVLMVIGYQNAEWVDVWTPPTFLIHVNNLLMLLAVFTFIAGSFASPVRRVIRHPQLIAVKTWALAHLLVNGDLASIVLFGALLVWAVMAMIGTNKRDGKRAEHPPANAHGLIIHIAAGLAVFGVITYIHGWMLGVWTFPISP